MPLLSKAITRKWGSYCTPKSCFVFLGCSLVILCWVTTPTNTIVPFTNRNCSKSSKRRKLNFNKSKLMLYRSSKRSRKIRVLKVRDPSSLQEISFLNWTSSRSWIGSSVLFKLNLRLFKISLKKIRKIHFLIYSRMFKFLPQRSSLRMARFKICRQSRFLKTKTRLVWKKRLSTKTRKVTHSRPSYLYWMIRTASSRT